MHAFIRSASICAGVWFAAALLIGAPCAYAAYWLGENMHSLGLPPDDAAWLQAAFGGIAAVIIGAPLGTGYATVKEWLSRPFRRAPDPPTERQAPYLPGLKSVAWDGTDATYEGVIDGVEVALSGGEGAWHAELKAAIPSPTLLVGLRFGSAWTVPLRAWLRSARRVEAAQGYGEWAFFGAPWDAARALSVRLPHPPAARDWYELSIEKGVMTVEVDAEAVYPAWLEEQVKGFQALRDTARGA